MKNNLKKPKPSHNNNDPSHSSGIITKCLQQMINVTKSNPQKSTSLPYKSTKTVKNIASSIRLSTVPENEEYEKPREEIPLPHNKEISIKKYSLSPKRNYISLDYNKEYLELRKKIESIMGERKALMGEKKKNAKSLEYKLMLDDFYCRLLQKLFYVVVKQRVFEKKNKKSTSELFYRKLIKRKIKNTFNFLKNYRLKQQKKKELTKSLILCMRFNIQKRCFFKLLQNFQTKTMINEKKASIERMSLFYSLKYSLKKMNEFKEFSKRINDFIQRKKKRVKFHCFGALRPMKFSVPVIKDIITNLAIEKQEINFNHRLNIFLQKTLKKQFLSIRLHQPKTTKQNNLTIFFAKNMRKINFNDVRTSIIVKQEKFLKEQIFNAFKINYMQKRKIAMAIAYHEMRAKNNLFQTIKTIFKRNNENLTQKIITARKFRCFFLMKAFFCIVKRKNLEKETRKKLYFLAKTFNLLKKYCQYKRNKKECLLSISKAYFTKFKSKILHKWLMIANDLQPINYLYKISLKKRYLKKMGIMVQKKQILKKYLLFLSEQNDKKTEECSQFALLKDIMREWKMQVIESENTKHQKIHNFMATNHWNNHLKVKAFSIWKQRKGRKKALSVFISYISRSLNEKIIQKWRKFVFSNDFRMKEVQSHLQTFLKNTTFQRLKGNYLQEKIIKSFRKRVIFSNWKAGFLFRRKYWPLKLYQMNLKKKVFHGFFISQDLQTKKLRIKSCVDSFWTRNKFKIFFRECVKLVALRKKYEYLVISRQIKLMKKIFNAIRTNNIRKKLKYKQLKLARRFHEENFKRKRTNIGNLTPELLIFKVFSIMKSNYLRKNAEKMIVNRLQVFRKRKTLRKMFDYWEKKCEKPANFNREAKRNAPNLYEFDFRKYDTPKFQIPFLNKSFNSLKESKNSNISSYASWLQQYEENEKYMLNLLSEK